MTIEHGPAPDPLERGATADDAADVDEARPEPAPALPPDGPGAPPPEPERRTILIALALVAILAGGALFASGYSLGLRQSLTPGTPADEASRFEPFWEAWRTIEAEYVGDLDADAVIRGAIRGMFDALGDRFSSYMPPDEYQQTMDDLSGEFEGIGAEMRSRTATGGDCERLGPGCSLVVEGVLPGSPAEQAGLAVGDVLVAVDGLPVDGKTIDDVVAVVRGPRGTEVILSLDRGGTPLELPIVRDTIRTDDVDSHLLADGSVGYLRIDGFSGSAADGFHDDLASLLDQGARGIVIDLRDDPGGFVDAAARIASELVASGPVFWEEDASGTQVPTDASGDGIATDPGIPVVVLVNGGTASASEILAGAIQDTGRGILVGQPTYGKGTIQQWHVLSNDSGGFRLSVAKWLTPAKRWIHGTGLVPDILVGDPDPSSTTDPQLDRALAELAARLAAASTAPGSSTAPSGSPAPASASAVPAAPSPAAS